MTGRLKLMLAVLAVIAALLVLDRPPEPALVEVSEQAPRISRPALAVAAPPPMLPIDAPIPDLFAHPAAPTAAPAQAERAETPTRQPAARPFSLVGLREESGTREAYLLDTGNGEVATVRAGDLVRRRYRVLAVHGDRVDIKDNVSGASIRIGFEDHQ